MSRRVQGLMVLAVGVVLGLSVATTRPSGQVSGEAIRRTADGHPDLTGVWQVMNAAAADLEDHSARLGVPAGQSVVEGDIPYQPGALKQKQENARLAAE